MHKRVISVLLVGLFLLSGFTPVHASINAKPNVCFWRWWWPHRISVPALKRTIVCTAERHGVSPSKALQVAECESSYYPYARSPSGRYLGVFQLSRSEFRTFWAKARRWWHPYMRDRSAGVFNGRANILAAVAYVRSAGWGPWSCA